ncbi:MAG TPA: NAD(P)-dependent alcohol dehydrogenase [Nocardioides sp.]|nr:NAD(P)-dependent alcohol dehydrogenase [Nocardioides sp.]
MARMTAVVQESYGGPEVLSVREVPRPEPAAGQVLVRVRAAALNAADWHIMRGLPLFARLTTGLRSPRGRVRGSDVAGVVEAVGSGVTRWGPGDEVYGELGLGGGGFATYAVVREDLLVRRPESLSPTQAAAVPLAGRTALVCLRETARLRQGQRLLVNGASGGVGTFAVQLGHALGADVTGVCSTRNVELVRSLGAKRVVDYTREDVATLGETYDVVLDLVGNRRLRDLRRLVSPGGVLVLSGGGTSTGRRELLGPAWLMVRGKLSARFLPFSVAVPQTPESPEQLADLAALVEAGTVTPVLDRTFPLTEAAAAMSYLEGEHARAKVVLTVD